MCGIAGKVSLDEPVDPLMVDRMCAVLEHRGPDERGTFLDDGVGLGVQRLAVIDPNGGHQPISNEDGSVVVVLNGEIYNYRELREDLSRRGHRLATASDTEVIVHLYEDHGDACVEELRGMFAFALWDRRRRRLLLARDRVGKKPLFYSSRAGALVFASETRAILQDPAVPRDADPAAIDSFLRYGYVPQPRSAFAALSKLPAAHLLTWQDGRCATRRYWRLSYRPRLAGVSERDLHELIRDHLLEATRLRLRSDVPLGALLSGGVDSSSVVAAMARTTSGRVKTYSVGFDMIRADETPYARAVARLYDTEHHELELGPDSVAVLPQIVWHHGEPFADTASIPSFHLARLAAAHVTVALSGDGGDESFAGYQRYRKLTAPRRGRDQGLAARYSRLVTYDFFDDAALRHLYAPEFLERTRAADPLAVIAAPLARSDAPDDLGRVLDVDVQTYLCDDILAKMDIAAMAHSLEVRMPLLDHVFLEAVAAIPTERKLDAAKRLYRDALRGWLPDRLLDRPKHGFSVPLGDWLRGRLRQLPHEILLDRRSVGRRIFREHAVRELIRGHMLGAADNAGRLWALMQLELWLRAYVDRRPVAPESSLALA